MVGDTSWLPLVVLLPVHPFDAVQLVALVLLQVSVLLPPEVRLVGLALSVTTGAAAVTVTVMVCATDPPVPVHVSVYDVVVDGMTDSSPDMPLVPLHPFDAVHDDALVVLQLSELLVPCGTEAGLALNVNVGPGTTVTVANCDALPPVPVHDNV